VRFVHRTRCRLPDGCRPIDDSLVTRRLDTIQFRERRGEIASSIQLLDARERRG
jgi:hypothetical protein